MAEQIETPEAEAPEQEAEAVEAQQADQAQPETTPEAANDENEVEITLEGESPPPEEEQQRAPEWVRELRKADREKARRIRELEAKLGEKQDTSLPAKPTLEACEFDAEKFEAKLADWYERKRAHDQAEQQKRQQAEAAQAAWAETLATYGAEKKALRVADFTEAEDAVKDGLTEAQQGIILHVAEKRAELVYALGKSPKKLRELAAITDPLKFAGAIAKLETALKVTPRKTAPLPESVPRGKSGIAMGVDAKLAELEAEAERTGDRTRVAQYRRELKQRQAA